MSEQKVRCGERIREERERLGLKQNGLGVAPKTQRFYEIGERSPDAEYLGRFADIGADVLYIVTGRRSSGALDAECQALIDAYLAAPIPIRSAAMAVLGSVDTQPDVLIRSGEGETVVEVKRRPENKPGRKPVPSDEVERSSGKGNTQ